MLTPKRHFDNLLHWIESEKPYSQADPGTEAFGRAFCAAWSGLPLSPWTENERECLMLKPTALKIMRSEKIFYEGGLKGADNPGGGLRYESHPIKDLDQFIYDLAWCFYLYEQKISGYDPEFQARLVFEGVRYLRLFQALVERFKGKQKARKVETLLDKLKKLKREIEAEPDILPDVSKPQLKRKVAEIFKKHIQAPQEIMATQSAELLNTFNIKAEMEGMREYFKGK